MPDAEYAFVWKIENFKLCLISNGKRLYSPVFKAPNLKGTEWYLEISEEEGSLSCYLMKKEDDGVDEISVKFDIGLRSSESVIFESLPSSEIYTFTKEDLSWGFSAFYEIDKMKKLYNYINQAPIYFHCKIWMPDSYDISTSNFKATTKFADDRFSFYWKVKEIDSLTWEDSKIVRSSAVDIKIIITCPDDFVCIIIDKLDKGNNTLKYISCKISLLDIKETERYAMRAEHVFTSVDKNQTLEFPDFIEKKKLLLEKDKFLKNGLFTLLFKVWISDGDCIEYIEEYNKNELVNVHQGPKEDTVKVLQEDLKQMFTKHLQTDASLLTETKTFQAHKCLLSARSPVFAAMFQQGMMENQTGIVNMSDVDAKVLESFLEFVYTGNVHLLEHEDTLKLLIMADKYQVISLKKKCSSSLMSNLSIVNVCDVVAVADMVNDDVLKLCAMNYIVAHADIVLISEKWLQCIQNDSKLARDIFHKLAIKGKIA